MSKMTKKKFLKLSPAEIGKLDKNKLKDVLRGARQLFNAQEKVFEKYKDKVWSGALAKMQDFYDENTQKPVSKMNMSQMRSEVFRLQDFFESKTSTVPGARKVMKEQDERIFGVNEKTGRPNRRMTLEERNKFWAAYNTFVSLHSEDYIRRMGSNTIQQYLGDIVMSSRGNLEIGADFFAKMARDLEARKAEEEWEAANWDGDTDSLLSGKWLPWDR